MFDNDFSGYNVENPRPRERNPHKISQNSAGKAGRWFRYGDDVDAEENIESRCDGDNKIQRSSAFRTLEKHNVCALEVRALDPC